MISAPTGGRPKVIGSSMAMVASGPTPGSTPISVPTSAPIRHRHKIHRRERDAEAEGEIVQEVYHDDLHALLMRTTGPHAGHRKLKSELKIAVGSQLFGHSCNGRLRAIGNNRQQNAVSTAPQMSVSMTRASGVAPAAARMLR